MGRKLTEGHPQDNAPECPKCGNENTHWHGFANKPNLRYGYDPTKPIIKCKDCHKWEQVDKNKLQALPKTRQQALSEKSHYYFTGKPCKRGHLTVRLTNGTCLECYKDAAKFHNNKWSVPND